MQSEESPCAWSIGKIRAVIMRDFPRFRGARLKVLRRAHNLVVEMDHRFVFKFPWHPRSNCRIEIAALRTLRGRLSVAIPLPQFVGARWKFFGSPRIPGHRPRVEEVRRWDGTRRAALARDIARLCVEVQDAIRPGMRGRLLGSRALPDPALTDRDEELFRRIFSRDRRLLTTAGKVFEAYRAKQSKVRPRDLRFVGFDLQFDNLLVDRTGRLIGALDFGYLTWQDAPGVFGLLCKDDPELARLAMKEFEPFAGSGINARHAELDGLSTVLCYLVELSTNRWDLAGRKREWMAIAKRALAERGY